MQYPGGAPSPQQNPPNQSRQTKNSYDQNQRPMREDGRRSKYTNSTNHMPIYFSVTNKQQRKKTNTNANKRKTRPASYNKRQRATPMPYPIYGGNGQQGTGGRPVKKLKKKNGLLRFVIAAIFVGMAVFGIYFLTTLSALKPYDSTFFPNIYVNGIDLGGKTMAQGRQLVYDNAQNFINNFSLQLTYQGNVYTEITSNDLNITFDQAEVDQQLYQAFLIGHKGYLFERKKVLDQCMQEPIYFTSSSLSKNTKVIDHVLDQMQQDFYIEPENAIREFTPGTGDNFTSQQEKPGQSIDPVPVQAEILEKIERMESGFVVLDKHINQILPEVALDSLEDNVVLRAVYETPINMRTKTQELKTNSQNRLHNIKLSIETMNEALAGGIPNGGKFSFNAVVGKRTADAGYQEAIEYVYGEQVWGIGGGVCQTSTTIYMAAIQAGMDITERYPHSIKVGYQPVKGKDATVFWEYDRKLDLAFVNNSGAPIYIIGKVLDGKEGDKICRVEIYGAPMNGISYDIRTVEEPIMPPEGIKVIKDDKQRFVTYKDEEPHFIPAEEGVKVHRYLVTYENGIEIGTRDIGSDTYKAKQAVEYVGTQERPFDGF